MDKCIENTLPKDLFNKINEVRINPVKMANKLTLIMSYINKRDNILREPNKPQVTLVEGIKVFEEIITLLKNTQPLEPFTWDDTLAKIAQDHASDIGHKGISGNSSSDGKHTFEDRFKRFGTFTELQEAIVMSETDPMKIVTNLLVCDGEPKRINRNIILSNTLKQIGIGTDMHSKSNIVNVIDFTSNWKLRTTNQSSSSGKSKFQQSNFSYLIKKGLLPEKEKPVSLGEIVENVEKELDKDFLFENITSRKDDKQVMQDGNTYTLVKRISFLLPDGQERKVKLSKTWILKN